MLDLYIGKVVEVSNTLISVAINKELETPYVVINSKPIRIAGVGNFLKIENSIYEIISEKTALESNNKEVSVKIASNRLVVCKVIGFFEQNEFKQGSSGETPNIFDNVYTVSDMCGKVALIICHITMRIMCSLLQRTCLQEMILLLIVMTCSEKLKK